MSKFRDMIEEMKTKDFSPLSTEEKGEWLRKLQEAHVSHLIEYLRSGEVSLRKIENKEGKK